MFKLLFFLGSVSSSTAFIASRPLTGRVSLREQSLLLPKRLRTSSICRRNVPSISLGMSGFDFLMETIIPSTLFITAFIVTLQRLATIESSSPELYDFETNQFTWPDFMRNHPFSTAFGVDTKTVPDSSTMIQTTNIEPQLQKDGMKIETETSEEKTLSNNGNISPVSPLQLKTEPLLSTPTSSRVVRRETFSTVKKTIASTLPGQKEKIERLKATETKKMPVEPSSTKAIPSLESIEDAKTVMANSETASVSQVSSSKVAQPPIRGRKRKWVAKILKKIIMPWRKWSSL